MQDARLATGRSLRRKHHHRGQNCNSAHQHGAPLLEPAGKRHTAGLVPSPSARARSRPGSRGPLRRIPSHLGSTRKPERRGRDVAMQPHGQRPCHARLAEPKLARREVRLRRSTWSPFWPTAAKPPARQFLLFVRCSSTRLQADSASVNVLKGEPASRTAPVFLESERHDATKPVRP